MWGEPYGARRSRSAPWQDRQGIGWVAADPESPRTVAVAVRQVPSATSHRTCKAAASFQEAPLGIARQTAGMLKTALRFLLLRFLPRRLVPLLTVIEIVRFIRRLRGGKATAVATPPRRLRTVGDGPGRNPIDAVVPADAVSPATFPPDASAGGLSRPRS